LAECLASSISGLSFGLPGLALGLYGGRFEGWGATLRSRGMGEQIAVPNGAKLIGVRGSGVSLRVGLEVRIGAMMAYIDDSSD